MRAIYDCSQAKTAQACTWGSWWDRCWSTWWKTTSSLLAATGWGELNLITTIIIVEQKGETVGARQLLHQIRLRDWVGPCWRIHQGEVNKNSIPAIASSTSSRQDKRFLIVDTQLDQASNGRTGNGPGRDNGRRLFLVEVSLTFLYSIQSTSSVNISLLVEQAGTFFHTLQSTIWFS